MLKAIILPVTNKFEILDGKFGTDTRREFTFINKMSNTVIYYALASEGISSNSLDFKMGCR